MERPGLHAAWVAVPVELAEGRADGPTREGRASGLGCGYNFWSGAYACCAGALVLRETVVCASGQVLGARNLAYQVSTCAYVGNSGGGIRPTSVRRSEWYAPRTGRRRRSVPPCGRQTPPSRPSRPRRQLLHRPRPGGRDKADQCHPPSACIGQNWPGERAVLGPGSGHESVWG